MRRLDSGGIIDRTRPLNFSFDSKNYVGYQGDSLASALLASNVRLVARSFKYHRRRGILTAGSEEPNALVEIGDENVRMPNTKMTTQILYEGLKAKSQNAEPSLDFDYRGINALFGRFLSAGFYYKTFMGKRRNTKFWMFCEKYIRRAAGLGKAASQDDHAYFEHIHAHTDVLIVGGGVAGLWSAYQLALQGKNVILADENMVLGNALMGSQDKIDGMGLYEWGSYIIRQLKSKSNVTLLASSTVFGFYDGNIAGVLEHIGHHSVNIATKNESNRLLPSPYGIPYQRRWKIYFDEVILATGAIERPILFGNNDLPGVMLAGAVRRYVSEYAVLPCEKKAVLFTNNDDAYQAAFLLNQHGVRVTVVDCRNRHQIADRARAKGIDVYCSAVVTKAIGKKQVQAVKIHSYDAAREQVSKNYQILKTELLIISGGFTPAVHLLCHLGARAEITDDEGLIVKDSPFVIAGSVSGMKSIKAVMESAHKAVDEILQRFDSQKKVKLPKIDEREFSSKSMPLWEVPSNGKGLRFIDYQHDVTSKDLYQASDEGYLEAEHAKRYTTAGMATDQGKLSLMNITAILARAQGKSLADIGTTTFRPPYIPISLGAFAGAHRNAHSKPVRKTPIHHWHESHHAVMVEAGLWMRPRYYRGHGRNINEAYIFEMRKTRAYAGLCDVSTLGKIDVMGPDAGKFLDRIYVNKFSNLAIGKARYGVMLREDGFIFDDGTSARIDENHYYMTTTTAKAAQVLQHLEYYLSVIWSDLRVRVASVTDQWAAMSLAGPSSRKILSRLLEDVDDQSLPFMGVKDTVYREVPIRVMRVSFSGEMAYELHTPARFGDFLWKTVLKLGGSEITPYGTETLGALRIEKGHIAGPEIDGHTTLADVGLAGMASATKHFIGQHLAVRSGMKSENREQLVGLKFSHQRGGAQGGATVMANVIENGRKKLLPVGRVTSTTFSVALDRYIALAMVQGGRQMHGRIITVRDSVRGTQSEAEICHPIFYDKEGEKVRG